jgi:hypothetical protein
VALFVHTYSGDGVQVKVFISWSGNASREVAEALADWFPKVIQGVRPFVSAKDIDKGANWTVELAKELEDADFGVICLNPDNLLSPWLNYEAGAITKSVTSRVCPILHGVSKSDVNPPIAQLQMTEIDVDDFKLLMGSMNKSMGSPLSSSALDESVDVWWPMLKKSVDTINAPDSPPPPRAAQEPEQPEASVTEMLTELLHRMRDVDQRIRRVERDQRVRRPERESTAPRPATLGSAQDELLNLLLASRMSPDSGRMTNSGIEVNFERPLPEPLPTELYTAVGSLARRSKIQIRISGADRDVVFDEMGDTSEPPF